MARRYRQRRNSRSGERGSGVGDEQILLRKLGIAFGKPNFSFLYVLLTSYTLAIGPMGTYVLDSLPRDGELVSGDQAEPEQRLGIGR
jgi:hypothetical protein